MAERDMKLSDDHKDKKSGWPPERITNEII